MSGDPAGSDPTAPQPPANRLAGETSPYLLQHAHNPVDWFPWGEEAFEKARAEDKPVFLSVGYSTCHWCHVMERESFERDDVAEILNEGFVAIKVDREERPDIDAIYMTATQVMTRHGGWPNSVWLMPDGRPWFAGTYFPREDRAGRPGFKTLLRQLGSMWNDRRPDVDAQANQLSDAIRSTAKSSGGSTGEESTVAIDADLVDGALRELRLAFDAQNGGFGDAPKFPPHGALRLLLHVYRRTEEPQLRHLITTTLDRMADGGIHDHIGGGFHRYATDRQWLLPHFEKMLYDNAQLARVYVDGARIFESARYEQVARGICDWVLREMTDEAGGFYSAYDADSEGEEGKFYVWTRDEIMEVLGSEDGPLFCQAYRISELGNFLDEVTGERPGTNIPHLQDSLDDIAEDVGLDPEVLSERLAAAREKLLGSRGQRIWPHLDDKVLTAWNGLMIGSLAHAGWGLGEPRYTRAAERAAAFVGESLTQDGRLQRAYRDGHSHLNGYLDDYAFLAEGLLDLHDTTGDAGFVDQARTLVETLFEHFQGPDAGAFYFTSDDHEKLLLRSRDPYDHALPSGNGAAARVLLRLAEFTGESRYEAAARTILETFGDSMLRAPRGTDTLILATAELLEAEVAEGSSRAEAIPDWADLTRRHGPVEIHAYASRLEVAPGDDLEIALRLLVEKGWHVGGPVPTEGSAATTVTVNEDAVVAEAAVELPTPDPDEDPPGTYSGEIVIRLTLDISPEAPHGLQEVPVTLEFQPCGLGRCLAPHTQTLRFPLRVEEESGPVRFPGIWS